MVDVVANGVRHHVQRLGAPTAAPANTPVVFVHGLVMDNLSSFYFTLANPVAARTEAILYDLRGHGLSDRPSRGYAVADLVADLAALLDTLAIRAPVAIVGNSFGGLVALAFAIAHPDRVARLALVDAHDGTGGWAAQMAATLALRGDARDAKIAESFRAWLGRHSERKRNRLAAAAEALVDGTSLVADLRDSPGLTAAQLATVRCPTLAVYGERSDVYARGVELARTLPACELVVVPGCTHSVLWEATAEVRARVVAFVTAGSAGTAEAAS